MQRALWVVMMLPVHVPGPSRCSETMSTQSEVVHQPEAVHSSMHLRNPGSPLRAGLQQRRPECTSDLRSQDMAGPEVPTALREAHLQLVFDVLTERARVAWTLKQQVRGGTRSLTAFQRPHRCVGSKDVVRHVSYCSSSGVPAPLHVALRS